jgi:hypothetical protein
MGLIFSKRRGLTNSLTQLSSYNLGTDPTDNTISNNVSIVVMAIA